MGHVDAGMWLFYFYDEETIVICNFSQLMSGNVLTRSWEKNSHPNFSIWYSDIRCPKVINRRLRDHFRGWMRY